MKFERLEDARVWIEGHGLDMVMEVNRDDLVVYRAYSTHGFYRGEGRTELEAAEDLVDSIDKHLLIGNYKMDEQEHWEDWDSFEPPPRYFK